MAGDKCDSSVTWVMDQGINLHPDWYPGLSTASSYQTVQEYLFNTTGECFRPCRPRSGIVEAEVSIAFKVCRDAVAGEPCDASIRQVEDGIRRNPSMYPGLGKSSSRREIQLYLHNASRVDPSPISCPAPCDDCKDAEQASTCATTIWNKLKRIREPLTSPYAGAFIWSGFPELQSILHRYGQGDCPQPCTMAVSSDLRGQCPDAE